MILPGILFNCGQVARIIALWVDFFVAGKRPPGLVEGDYRRQSMKGCIAQ